MGKNILIFSDGTGQAGGITPDERRSNIYKLYRATRVGPDSSVNPAEQVAYYDAGLGSLPPGGGSLKSIVRVGQNFVSSATGYGLTTNIIDCYEMIIRLWRPGDRIFLFGFSRGAYTVRCLAAVLCLCGIPTRLEDNKPMRYDSRTARRVATIGVKKVYQHCKSNPRDKASKRENELMDQRLELGRQFCETHASREANKSEYPFFIGVFDTVASVASTGALFVLTLALAAAAATISAALWYMQVAYSQWLGGIFGKVLSWIGVNRFNPTDYWHWLLVVVGLFVITAVIVYLKEHIRFAPSADRKRPWRTFTTSWGRMRFEDKSLNDNIKYARHAIALDENRASFRRVGWGDPKSTRPYQDEKGIITFRQYWFAGVHSDIGGSYTENEARLSDLPLAWMIETAQKIEGGIKIDQSVLRLHPSHDGIQHDERKSGYPLLTKWTGFTWKSEERKLPDEKVTTIHPSVVERMKLTSVVHFDEAKPYRPETLRKHEKCLEFYKEIPLPLNKSPLATFIERYFVKSGY